ncbi:MAG TPA: hypothetical protein VHH88_09005, partial [Verrucomicrobiae bacterium]|nr:hypothetical protein [Verrucomicrobiae bacterium]
HTRLRMKARALTRRLLHRVGSAGNQQNGWGGYRLTGGNGAANICKSAGILNNAQGPRGNHEHRSQEID